MPTYSIPLGVPTAIAQNVVYALPARRVRFMSAAVCEYSLLEAGPFTAINPPAGTVGADGVGGFIRCTTGATTVTAGA